MVAQRTLYPKSMNKHEEVCFNTINDHEFISECLIQREYQKNL